MEPLGYEPEITATLVLIQLNYKHEFSGSPDQVAALFRNKTFTDDVAKHTNAVEHTVSIADDVTHLDLALPAPESISKFFGEGIRVRQPFTWGGSDNTDVREGIFTVDIADAPISIEADATLSPTGPSSSEAVCIGELSVKIPLVSKKVGARVEPMIARAPTDIERWTQDWLGRV